MKKMNIITGADDSRFKSLLQFLTNVTNKTQNTEADFHV